jgi:hypothetical protein
LSKKGVVVRKLVSDPRTRRVVIKLLAKPKVRRGVVRLAKNPRVRRVVGKQVMSGRSGRRKTGGRAGRTSYGGAVGLGIGALVIVIVIPLYCGCFEGPRARVVWCRRLGT